MNDNSCMHYFQENVTIEFGKRVRNERKSQGLSIEELAELANVSIDTIKRYESGKTKSGSIDVAYNIARALNISIADLFPETVNKDMLENNSNDVIKDLYELIKIIKKIINKLLKT